MKTLKPLLSIAGSFLALSSVAWIGDAQGEANQQGQAGASIDVQQPQPEVTVQQPAPRVQVQQPQPDVTVQQPPPSVTVQQPQPEVTVQQPKPEVRVQQQGEPQVTVQEQGKPQVNVQQEGQPQVTVQEQGKPEVNVQGGAETGAAAQASASQATAVPQTGFRSTVLTGRDVKTAQGEKIGDIHDLVIRRNGQVSQVILDADDKRVAVPFDQLQLAGQDYAVYQGTKQQLQQLPQYDPQRLSNEETVPPIVGREVRNAQNQQIGKVDDLIIGPDGGVGVVLSVGGFLGIGDRLVAVPFHAIQLTGHDYVLYEGDKQQLAQLPAFDYDQLQRGVGGVTQEAAPERRQEGEVR